MKPNRLREKLNAGEPTIGTHLICAWPGLVEVMGHTGVFDYIEYVAEYSPLRAISRCATRSTKSRDSRGPPLPRLEGTEGPFALAFDNCYVVYYDACQCPQHIDADRSYDLEHQEDVTV